LLANMALPAVACRRTLGLGAAEAASRDSLVAQYLSGA
jgi:hypothetical protein